jgi:hypothetical protein
MQNVTLGCNRYYEEIEKDILTDMVHYEYKHRTSKAEMFRPYVLVYLVWEIFCPKTNKCDKIY